MEGWSCVFTTGNLQEAEIIRGLLEDNQITSFLINKQDSVYLFGDIEIYVAVEDAFSAKQLINNPTCE